MKGKLAGGILLLLLTGIFFWTGTRNLDPDFGWHLKVGQMMISEGIPRTDPFSYTMPSFLWSDHGRLSDVAIAWLYPKIGMPGLAAIAALVATTALMVVVPATLWSAALVPLLLGAGVFVVRFGVRPQVEDWLFTAVLLRATGDENIWKRWKWLIPVWFAIWANFHGGFLLGLVIIGVRIIGKWRETKKFNPKDMAVLILAILATLVNPYGLRLWGEIWLTVSDANLRSGIAEWQPFFMKTEMGYWLLTALFFALFKVYGKIISGWRVILACILLLGSISSLRNTPFYVLAVIPLTAELMSAAHAIVKKNREIFSRARKFYAILLVIAGLLFFIEAGVAAWKTAKGGGIIYPEKATYYLQNNPVKGRLFTDYGWGGYLIWKLPGEKVFIDGRMPSWRWIAPSGESTWAFKDYQKIVNEGDYEKLFEKYGIKTVLWPKGDILGNQQISYINFSGSWWWEWLVNKTGGKPQKSFIEKLKDSGWKIVYEDKEAVVYVSPPNTN